MKEFWQSCLLKFEQELPPQQLNAWIKPLTPVEINASKGQLRLLVPNRHKLEWVKKNFLNQIEQLATDWYGQPIAVLLEIAPIAVNPVEPTPLSQPVLKADVNNPNGLGSNHLSATNNQSAQATNEAMLWRASTETVATTEPIGVASMASNHNASRLHTDLMAEWV
jgi:chromosomal replication initiator protein